MAAKPWSLFSCYFIVINKYVTGLVNRLKYSCLFLEEGASTFRWKAIFSTPELWSSFVAQFVGVWWKSSSWEFRSMEHSCCQVGCLVIKVEKHQRCWITSGVRDFLAMVPWIIFSRFCESEANLLFAFSLWANFRPERIFALSEIFMRANFGRRNFRSKFVALLKLYFLFCFNFNVENAPRSRWATTVVYKISGRVHFRFTVHWFSEHDLFPV